MECSQQQRQRRADRTNRSIRCRTSNRMNTVAVAHPCASRRPVVRELRQWAAGAAGGRGGDGTRMKGSKQSGGQQANKPRQRWFRQQRRPHEPQLRLPWPPVWPWCARPPCWAGIFYCCAAPLRPRRPAPPPPQSSRVVCCPPKLPSWPRSLQPLTPPTKRDESRWPPARRAARRTQPPTAPTAPALRGRAA